MSKVEHPCIRDEQGKCVADPMPGDYVQVVTTDDSLIKSGSFGVVEGQDSQDVNRLTVTFNFTTPFRHKGEDGEYVQASGGPVRSVRRLDFIGTKETRNVQEHDLTKDILREDMPTRERTVRVFKVNLAGR